MNKYSRYFVAQTVRIIITIAFMVVSLTIMSNRIGTPVWNLDVMKTPVIKQTVTTFSLRDGSLLHISNTRFIAACLSWVLFFVTLLLCISYSLELLRHIMKYLAIRRAEKNGELVRTSS